MTYADAFHASFMRGLPDPGLDPQFYRGVPSRRLAAWVIDVFVTLAVGVPLALAFGLLTLGFGLVIFPLILLAVGFFYRWATISAASATWGMRAMGIELRRFDGSRLDPFTAVAHTALYTFCMAVMVLQALSVVGMAASRYGQGLPDLVLRTTMINRPAD